MTRSTMGLGESYNNNNNNNTIQSILETEKNEIIQFLKKLFIKLFVQLYYIHL